MERIDSLVKLLSRLPGIGGKSASRIAYHLIGADETYNKALGDAISTIKENIHFCPVCGAYAEADRCEYCLDEGRDKSLLCVVEQPQDVITIASAPSWKDRIRKRMEERKLIAGEISLPEFSRSFSLPEDSDAAAITADSTNGILTITIPRIRKTEPGRIEVKIGK